MRRSLIISFFLYLIFSVVAACVVHAATSYFAGPGAEPISNLHGFRHQHPYILETDNNYPGGIQDAVDAAEEGETVVIPAGSDSAYDGFTTVDAADHIGFRLDYLQPACIYINSDVTLVPGNNLYIDIGGTWPCHGHAAGDYDRLSLYDDATINLGGANLVINLLDGFEPQPGDRFKIVVSSTPNGITGTFSNGYIIKAQNFYFHIHYNNMVAMPDKSTIYAVSLTAITPMFKLEIINAGKKLN